MTKPKKKRLNDAEKAFVVRELAGFGSPKEVSTALMEEMGVQLAPQNIECYDPGKRAGQHLSKKWRELFAFTRQSFLDEVSNSVPLAHKAVRIRELARGARAFKDAKNYLAMAKLLEQIAREVGGAFTNRRELTGRDAGPIKFQDVGDMTDEQIRDELLSYGIDPAQVHPAPGSE